MGGLQSDDQEEIEVEWNSERARIVDSKGEIDERDPR